MGLISMKNRRYINEMAQSAEKRIYGRLANDRKAIYITGKFLEQNPTISSGRDIAKIKAKLKAYIERQGMDWEEYCTIIQQKMDINPQEMTSYYEFNRRFKEENDGRLLRLYNRIARTINVNKDDIDKNFVDKFFQFIKYNQSETLDKSYNDLHMGDFIEWFKQNPEEAQDRFGHNYNVIKKRLAKWLDPNYANTPNALLDIWNDYVKLKRKGEEPQLSEDTLYKLAAFMQSPEITRYYDSAKVTKFLEMLTPLFPNETLPTIEECNEFLGIGDDTPFEEMSPRSKIKYIIRNNLPEDLVPTINIKEIVEKFLRDNPDVFTTGINADDVGKGNKDVVRDVCQYAINNLNRSYRQDTFKPFVARGLQEFYNNYKPVFQLGFTTDVYKKLFKEIAIKLKDAHAATGEVAEAMRIMQRHGFIVE